LSSTLERKFVLAEMQRKLGTFAGRGKGKTVSNFRGGEKGRIYKKKRKKRPHLYVHPGAGESLWQYGEGRGGREVAEERKKKKSSPGKEETLLMKREKNSNSDVPKRSSIGKSLSSS